MLDEVTEFEDLAALAFPEEELLETLDQGGMRCHTVAPGPCCCDAPTVVSPPTQRT